MIAFVAGIAVGVIRFIAVPWVKRRYRRWCSCYEYPFNLDSRR